MPPDPPEQIPPTDIAPLVVETFIIPEKKTPCEELLLPMSLMSPLVLDTLIAERNSIPNDPPLAVIKIDFPEPEVLIEF
jgi:hypothetical protein